MVVRTRTLNGDLYPPGTRTRFGDAVPHAVVYQLVETCQDHVQPGDNMPFEVNRTTKRGGVINSDYDGGYFTATFRDYAVDALTNGQLVSDYSFPDALPDDDYMSKAVQRTNPNKPYVDIGMNILEAGDCVRLVHEWGKDLMKWVKDQPVRGYRRGNGAFWVDAGKANLTYQFGIAPVLSDLSKLVNYRDQVDRRVKQIKRLMGPTGLRKTVELDNLSKTINRQILWQSADTWMQSYVDVASAQRVRGHCRWLPDIDFSSLSESSLEKMASRAVLGVTLDFATLWEAMPWSWLIDYCTNAGALISRIRNIVPCSLESAMLIKHSVTRYEIPRMRLGQHEMSPGHVIFERKQRYPVNMAFSAHLPFLSGSQMGILSSLAVTKR